MAQTLNKGDPSGFLSAAERISGVNIRTRESLPLCLTLKLFGRMIVSYWGNKDSLRSWLLLAIILCLTAGLVYLVTAFNAWSKNFWDAIQQYDLDEFVHQLIVFATIAVGIIVVSVYEEYLKSCLIINWRTWLTGKTLDRWLRDDNYFKLQLTDKYTDNPDQRIAEDLNLLVTNTLNLFVGTITDIAIICSFSVVLWNISGAVDLEVLGYTLSLPDGYMCYLAFTYAIIGTLITFLLGKPLVKLNFRQQRYEADFRFSLIRVRENSESISLYKGEDEEKKILHQKFRFLVDNFIKLISLKKRLGFLISGYDQIAVIFPILIAAPLYFAKVITVGSLMQISSAFSQVHSSLSTLVLNFPLWAEWKSVVDRLSLFYMSMEEAENLRCIKVKKDEQGIVLDNLQICTPHYKILANNINLNIDKGQALLIRGPSGCGKSTLLKAIAGIWPFARGEVHYLSKGKVLFLSQRPYLPQGSLRAAASYPQEQELAGSTEEYLKVLGLEHVIKYLDVEDTWSHILSLGEQQRVAIVRALLNKPDILFLDEATSAMDEKTESLTYDILRKNLPNTIFISVGHRSTLLAKHDLVLSYEGVEKGYSLSSSEEIIDREKIVAN